jgi:uncharacterized LabA/DUF88 family protein
MKNNICYIDGQNLQMGTTSSSPAWKVDLLRFRVYLSAKYSVSKAYYYLGYVQDGLHIEKLYENIQAAGFILVFRQHNSAMIGKKKGNVDSDIIFSVMKRICLKEKFDKIVLVSGDGDYKQLVDFLIEQNKLEKILYPNAKRRSSLYKGLSSEHFAALNATETMQKIGYEPNKKKRAT